MAVNGILLKQSDGAYEDLSNVLSISSEGVEFLEACGLFSKETIQSTMALKSAAWINDSNLKITKNRGEKPSSLYNEITTDKIYNIIAKQDDLTTNYYTVENTSKNNYGFVYNTYDGYYINTNSMVNSYAMAKITIKLDRATALSVKYYHNANSYYAANYGIIGKINSTLDQSNTADSSYLARTYRTNGVTLNSSVSLGTLSAGTHYFYVKYIHTSSYASLPDRFGFKIITATGEDFNRKENFNLPKKVSLKASISTTLSGGSTSKTTSLFSGVTAQKSYYIPTLNLFYKYQRQGGTANPYRVMSNASTSIVSGTTYEAWQLN